VCPHGTVGRRPRQGPKGPAVYANNKNSARRTRRGLDARIACSTAAGTFIYK